MHFTLRASDISSLCGRNCYRDRTQAMKALVESNVPSYSEPPAYRDVLWELEELVRSGPVYTEAISSRELAPPLAVAAEREGLGLFNRYTNDFPPMERRRVRNHIRTMYLKDRGLVMEVDTLKRLEDETGIVWWPTDRKRRFFTRTFVGERDPTLSYTINGSIDGFELDPQQDGDVCGLLEVKNRRDRIFHHPHDIDQVTMYVVLSGLDHGRLVQNVGGRIDATLLVTKTEAFERWNRAIRPLLEDALRECAIRLRSAAEETAAAWRPFTISHVVANPPPQRRPIKIDKSTQTLTL